MSITEEIRAMNPEEWKDIILNQLSEEKTEIGLSYKKTKDARKKALDDFRKSCDGIDELIEDRRHGLVTEISELEAEVEGLKSRWAIAVSSKDNAKAAEIEEKMALLQARMTTKEKLIDTICGDYDISLLEAFKAADDVHRKNVFALNAKIANYQNRIDGLINDLEAVKDIPDLKYTELEKKDVLNAERRMTHQKEYGPDEWPYQTSPVPAGDPGRFVFGVKDF